jgi:hypothetical protein
LTYRDGVTIRQIARNFHVSRRKSREALVSPASAPYTRIKRERPADSAPYSACRLKGSGPVLDREIGR